MHNTIRIVFLTALALSTTACVAPGLYRWGDYEQGLYSAYKDPTQVESLRKKLENHILEMEQTGQKVAPGLYAEVGTFYLQAGSPEQAIAMYAKERDAWPESKGLMTAMIQNLEKRQKAKRESSK